MVKSPNNLAPISVIVPCYRCASTINECVNSVLSQTMLPLEIILVDDCSDKQTVSILRELTFEKKVRIKLIENTHNKGASASRNIGVKKAKGDYLAFLDSDDIWHPRKLEDQYQFMLSNDSAFTAHAYLPNKTSKFFSETKTSRYKRVSLSQMLIANRISTPTVIVKKDQFIEFDERLTRAEDWKCWVETIIYLGGEIDFLKAEYSAGFKPALGYAGLSGDIQECHQSIIKAIKLLYLEKKISFYQLSLAMIAEMFKYPIRYLIVALKKSFLWRNIESVIERDY